MKVKASITMATHSAGGITDKDFELARKIEEVALWRPAAGSALEGRIDASRVAVMGHSAGGGAVQGLVDESELPILGWIGLATIGFFAALGLPGLNMFIGEALTFLIGRDDDGEDRACGISCGQATWKKSVRSARTAVSGRC